MYKYKGIYSTIKNNSHEEFLNLIRRNPKLYQEILQAATRNLEPKKQKSIAYLVHTRLLTLFSSLSHVIDFINEWPDLAGLLSSDCLNALIEKFGSPVLVAILNKPELSKIINIETAINLYIKKPSLALADFIARTYTWAEVEPRLFVVLETLLKDVIKILDRPELLLSRNIETALGLYIQQPANKKLEKAIVAYTQKETLAPLTNEQKNIIRARVVSNPRQALIQRKINKEVAFALYIKDPGSGAIKALMQKIYANDDVEPLKVLIGNYMQTHQTSAISALENLYSSDPQLKRSAIRYFLAGGRNNNSNNNNNNNNQKNEEKNLENKAHLVVVNSEWEYMSKQGKHLLKHFDEELWFDLLGENDNFTFANILKICLAQAKDWFMRTFISRENDDLLKVISRKKLPRLAEQKKMKAVDNIHTHLFNGFKNELLAAQIILNTHLCRKILNVNPFQLKNLIKLTANPSRFITNLINNLPKISKYNAEQGGNDSPESFNLGKELLQVCVDVVKDLDIEEAERQRFFETIAKIKIRRKSFGHQVRTYVQSLLESRVAENSRSINNNNPELIGLRENKQVIECCIAYPALNQMCRFTCEQIQALTTANMSDETWIAIANDNELYSKLLKAQLTIDIKVNPKQAEFDCARRNPFFFLRYLMDTGLLPKKPIISKGLFIRVLLNSNEHDPNGIAINRSEFGGFIARFLQSSENQGLIQCWLDDLPEGRAKELVKKFPVLTDFVENDQNKWVQAIKETQNDLVALIKIINDHWSGLSESNKHGLVNHNPICWLKINEPDLVLQSSEDLVRIFISEDESMDPTVNLLQKKFSKSINDFLEANKDLIRQQLTNLSEDRMHSLASHHPFLTRLMLDGKGEEEFIARVSKLTDDDEIIQIANNTFKWQLLKRTQGDEFLANHRVFFSLRLYAPKLPVRSEFSGKISKRMLVAVLLNDGQDQTVEFVANHLFQTFNTELQEFVQREEHAEIIQEQIKKLVVSSEQKANLLKRYPKLVEYFYSMAVIDKAIANENWQELREIILCRRDKSDYLLARVNGLIVWQVGMEFPDLTANIVDNSEYAQKIIRACADDETKIKIFSSSLNSGHFVAEIYAKNFPELFQAAQELASAKYVYAWLVDERILKKLLPHTPAELYAMPQVAYWLLQGRNEDTIQEHWELLLRILSSNQNLFADLMADKNLQHIVLNSARRVAQLIELMRSYPVLIAGVGAYLNTLLSKLNETEKAEATLLIFQALKAEYLEEAKKLVMVVFNHHTEVQSQLIKTSDKQQLFELIKVLPDNFSLFTKTLIENRSDTTIKDNILVIVEILSKSTDPALMNSWLAMNPTIIASMLTACDWKTVVELLNQYKSILHYFNKSNKNHVIDTLLQSKLDDAAVSSLIQFLRVTPDNYENFTNLLSPARLFNLADQIENKKSAQDLFQLLGHQAVIGVLNQPSCTSEYLNANPWLVTDYLQTNEEEFRQELPPSAFIKLRAATHPEIEAALNAALIKPGYSIVKTILKAAGLNIDLLSLKKVFLEMLSDENFCQNELSKAENKIILVRLFETNNAEIQEAVWRASEREPFILLGLIHSDFLTSQQVNTRSEIFIQLLTQHRENERIRLLASRNIRKLLDAGNQEIKVQVLSNGALVTTLQKAGYSFEKKEERDIVLKDCDPQTVEDILRRIKGYYTNYSKDKSIQEPNLDNLFLENQNLSAKTKQFIEIITKQLSSNINDEVSVKFSHLIREHWQWLENSNQVKRINSSANNNSAEPPRLKRAESSKLLKSNEQSTIGAEDIKQEKKISNKIRELTGITDKNPATFVTYFQYYVGEKAKNFIKGIIKNPQPHHLVAANLAVRLISNKETIDTKKWIEILKTLLSQAESWQKQGYIKAPQKIYSEVLKTIAAVFGSSNDEKILSFYYEANLGLMGLALALAKKDPNVTQDKLDEVIDLFTANITNFKEKDIKIRERCISIFADLIESCAINKRVTDVLTIVKLFLSNATIISEDCAKLPGYLLEYESIYMAISNHMDDAKKKAYLNAINVLQLTATGQKHYAELSKHLKIEEFIAPLLAHQARNEYEQAGKLLLEFYNQYPEFVKETRGIELTTVFNSANINLIREFLRDSNLSAGWVNTKYFQDLLSILNSDQDLDPASHYVLEMLYFYKHHFDLLGESQNKLAEKLWNGMSYYKNTSMPSAPPMPSVMNSALPPHLPMQTVTHIEVAGVPINLENSNSHIPIGDLAPVLSASPPLPPLAAAPPPPPPPPAPAQAGNKKKFAESKTPGQQETVTSTTSKKPEDKMKKIMEQAQARNQKFSWSILLNPEEIQAHLAHTFKPPEDNGDIINFDGAINPPLSEFIQKLYLEIREHLNNPEVKRARAHDNTEILDTLKTKFEETMLVNLYENFLDNIKRFKFNNENVKGLLQLLAGRVREKLETEFEKFQKKPISNKPTNSNEPVNFANIMVEAMKRRSLLMNPDKGGSDPVLNSKLEKQASAANAGPPTPPSLAPVIVPDLQPISTKVQTENNHNNSNDNSTQANIPNVIVEQPKVENQAPIPVKNTQNILKQLQPVQPAVKKAQTQNHSSALPTDGKKTGEDKTKQATKATAEPTTINFKSHLRSAARPPVSTSSERSELDKVLAERRKKQALQTTPADVDQGQPVGPQLK